MLNFHLLTGLKSWPIISVATIYSGPDRLSLHDMVHIDTVDPPPPNPLYPPNPNPSYRYRLLLSAPCSRNCHISHLFPFLCSPTNSQCHQTIYRASAICSRPDNLRLTGFFLSFQ